MPARPRHGKPWIFATWLTKTLAGEAQCAFAPWFKAHFRYDKRINPDFQLAAWAADHAEMVRARAEALQADGWRVRLEDANSFKLEGHVAIVSGKPDIVAFRGDDALIVDCKTGRERQADWWQVLLYLWALPLTWKDVPGSLLAEVQYRHGSSTVQPHELTKERRQQIIAAITAAAATAPPAAVPSAGECRFCDLTEHDCPARVSEPVATVAVEAF